MNKNNIDWKEFGKQLFWHLVVRHKNEYSGFDVMMEEGPESRGIHKGDIGHFSILSYVDPFSYKHLTYKELALELGLFKRHLISDGHDCHKCPEEEKCTAYFKYDPDHERCYSWEQLHPETKINDEED